MHEIAVGPVHAGIIEPGHFRFSVVGEKPCAWKNAWATRTRGSKNDSKSMTLQQGAKLPEGVRRHAVAYAWAYAMAVESIPGITPPARALWLRALFLERNASPTIW